MLGNSVQGTIALIMTLLCGIPFAALYTYLYRKSFIKKHLSNNSKDLSEWQVLIFWNAIFMSYNDFYRIFMTLFLLYKTLIDHDDYISIMSLYLKHRVIESYQD